MGGGKSKDLGDVAFDMKFAAKGILRDANKANQEEKRERNEALIAMQKNQYEIAKVHAENSIRCKNNYVNLMKLGARLESVAMQIQNAANVTSVSQQLRGATVAMESALKSMNSTEIANVMNKFEKEMEDMGVKSAVMEDSLNTVSGSAVNQSDVNGLLKQVADERGLILNEEMSKQLAPNGIASNVQNANPQMVNPKMQ